LELLDFLNEAEAVFTREIQRVSQHEASLRVYVMLRSDYVKVGDVDPGTKTGLPRTLENLESRGKNIGPGKSGNCLLGPGFFIFSSIFPVSGTSCRGRENFPDNRCESGSIKIKIQSFSVMTGMNYCVLQ